MIRFDWDYEVLMGRFLTWSSRLTMQHKELDSGPFWKENWMLVKVSPLLPSPIIHVTISIFFVTISYLLCYHLQFPSDMLPSPSRSTMLPSANCTGRNKVNVFLKYLGKGRVMTIISASLEYCLNISANRRCLQKNNWKLSISWRTKMFISVTCWSSPSPFEAQPHRHLCRWSSRQTLPSLKVMPFGSHQELRSHPHTQFWTKKKLFSWPAFKEFISTAPESGEHAGHVPSLHVQLVVVVCQLEHPQLAVLELLPRLEDVRQQQGQPSVVVKPPETLTSQGRQFGKGNLCKTDMFTVSISITEFILSIFTRRQ